MLWYAIASLTPAVLIVLACLFGAAFPVLALLSITGLVFFLDRLPKDMLQAASTGRALSLALALLHFPLITLGIWTLAASEPSPADKVLIFMALGMYLGQISNSNAHELIHASARLPRRLGAAVYITLLHGHHVSAHLLVHHVHAATDQDPNSARLGRGFWRYLIKTVPAEFRAGLDAETARRARISASAPQSPHPYVIYCAGGALALLISTLIAGPAGLAAHIGLAAYAQFQLLLSDYVQHYGLRRQTGANGKSEPIGPAHSWNAPRWYSSAMMLNAPRHSDHHVHPARAFPALEVTPATMPILPYSLPVMATIALVPPVWRQVMDHRVRHWQNAA